MRRMRSIRGGALGGLLLASSLLACSPNLVADNYGSAYQKSRERQTQNPEASEARTPVVGMGAATAAEVVENYHRNQKTSAQESRQDRARDSGISSVQ